MFTKSVKWTAIAALIGGGLSRSLPVVALLSQFVVAVSAAIVLTQAATMRRYVWMILFLVVACLFNPVFPLVFTTNTLGLATTFSVLLFFFSLEFLQMKPRLSIASITDRMPGSESL